ncbi:hypothetical protein GQ44DRAFT_146054 [Phaeosphaeriaceae sp. PMI808]|nr:hypothetical protein GQ44DRAFT_138153 [Phaeosphaeriaceae sp. PMI808]KAH8727031.1 hypothetical protein GQ44DRAFT_146054 [Phaeosphaeriaceae sp. PMI808]
MTYVRRPGKKSGLNKKCSPHRVLTYVTEHKHREKLLNKWWKEVGCDPQAEDDESLAVVEETPSPTSLHFQ